MTHSVDPRQLLGELQHDGDEEGLSVRRRAEQLQDRHFLLHGHLGALLLHLLQVFTHILAATQTHQRCRQDTNTNSLFLFWHTDKTFPSFLHSSALNTTQ